MSKGNNLPPMSLNSAASSSSLYSTGSSSGFPLMPPSPATASGPEHVCFIPTATTSSASVVQKCAVSRVNLEGSWLDLESDTECDSNDSYSLMRMRRKSSGASSKASGSVHGAGRNVLAANFKELTRRSSMHLRKLTGKMGSSSSSTPSA
ncbi:hypothetical protein GGI20_002585 [Coemansia sp. BCRC 34301]|nr:hypothetical protein GGI20_002585 [Coemansia sp. BCRC 34301]